MRRTPSLLASILSRWYTALNTLLEAADMLSNSHGQFAVTKNLVEQITELTLEKEKLLTPGVELIKLPFPTLSILQPTDRFAFDTNGNWDYMPRSQFSELLHQVEALIEHRHALPRFGSTVQSGTANPTW
ncbi:hypothetical protein BDD12DRAFT_127873 [Trichophaea hybrida]|nr:hypothetical protein BDD12DRAFT_127873 [Trichophaea hybrida]